MQIDGFGPYRRNHIEPGLVESRTQSPAPAKRSMPKGLIPGLFFVLTFVNICLVSTIVNCLQVVDRTSVTCRRLNGPLSGEVVPRAVNMGLCKWVVPTQTRAARAKKSKSHARPNHPARKMWITSARA